MTAEEFDQYIDQIYAVRKMGEAKKEIQEEDEKLRIKVQYVESMDIYQLNALINQDI